MSSFFPSFNGDDGVVCPVCMTADDKESMLIPIPGTEDAGISKAQQMHKDCANHVAYYLLKAIDPDALEDLKRRRSNI